MPTRLIVSVTLLIIPMTSSNPTTLPMKEKEGLLIKQIKKVRRAMERKLKITAQWFTKGLSSFRNYSRTLFELDNNVSVYLINFENQL